MKAMILAAGRGERMRPLTDHTPKPLLKVGGKPLIVWHIERLAKAGFTQIVINHAHLGQQIEDALQDGAQWGVQIQYSPEKNALETAGGIANALHLLTDNGTNNAPFLVVNGDVFSDFDFATLSSLWDKGREESNQAPRPRAGEGLGRGKTVNNSPTFTPTLTLPLSGGGDVEREGVEIGKTANNTSAPTPSPLMGEGWGEGKNLAHLILIDNPPQHPKGDFAIQNGMLKNEGKQMLTFSGIGVYHPSLFKEVTIGQPAKLAPLLRKAIDNNAATAQYYQGVWHDIGTPERLKILDEELLNI